MEKKRLIVITGCDSGIGKSICKILHNKGYSMAISYLNENPFTGENEIFAQKMDLRNEGEISEFASFVKKLCGYDYVLYGLVSNAGIALGGPVENIPMKLVREVLEVNFFGAFSLIQKLIPLLIESKGGIYLIGSTGGRVALPFLSPYTASKFAIEGFGESLRRELKPFGIRTVILEPGGIATPIWNKGKEQDSSFIDEKYMKSMTALRDTIIDGGNYGLDPDLAAEMILKIMLKKNPKPRYIIAKKNLSNYAPVYLPKRLMDRIIAGLLKMDYGKD